MRFLRRAARWTVVMLAAAIGVHYLVLLAASLSREEGSSGGGPVYFNEHFIEGLAAELDTSDPDQVFRLVYHALADEVDVYPTENYYYFQLTADGQTVWGNLRLDARDRDQGIVHLGYFVYDENGKFADREGRSKSYSSEDGVSVEQRGPWEYDVGFAGERKRFRLNPVTMEVPADLRLRPNEVFVGPVQDESGMAFWLIFDAETKHFMYLMNEVGGAPDQFYEAADEVVVGRRTGFAFYTDAAWSRKVLVGVHGANWARNNYYDGPFDQLPDNLVEETRLGDYIQEAYGYTAGEIDEFGHYLEGESGRVLIVPFFVYDDDTALDFVRSCRESGLSEAEFYVCITPDFFADPT